MGDGIGHVAVAGIGASLLFGTSPTWTALVVAVVAALVIEWLRARGSATGDLALALVFYGGIAAGVVLASRSATNTNLQPYLFGSILTATAERRVDGDRARRGDRRRHRRSPDGRCSRSCSTRTPPAWRASPRGRSTRCSRCSPR